jgi:protein-tyrosine phosphatase
MLAVKEASVPDVLFVCTANVCRSPLAERLLRQQLEAAFGAGSVPITVASAGVRARERSSMAQDAARVLRRRGADDREFGSRPLTGLTIGDPALVLTAERWHRRAVAVAQPRLVRKSFTLLEFARLVSSGAPPELSPGPLRQRVVALADAAAARRGSGVAADPTLDDLPDPVGGTLEDFEVCASRIDGALAVLIDGLGGQTTRLDGVRLPPPP